MRLLQRGIAVTVVVRSETRIPDAAKGHKLLTVVIAPGGHLCMGRVELTELLRSCSYVISCCGHRHSGACAVHRVRFAPTKFASLHSN